MGTLTDSKIRSLKYGTGPKKVYDGEGLFVHLTKTKSGTSKHFKYDFTIGGKRNQISYGRYPDIPLSKARILHSEARSLVANKIDPLQARREAHQLQIADQRTLEVIAEEFFESRNQWKQSHRKKELYRWHKHVAPFFGNKPIKSITRKQIKGRLLEIQADSIDTARRVQSLIDQVFVFAEVSDDIEDNPVTGLSKVLKKHTKTNYPAITHDVERLGALLNSIDTLGSKTSAAALQIVALTFVRHSGIRLAQWSEIDFERAVWTIPAQRMKISGNGDLVVPLARQTVAAFNTLRKYKGNFRYVLTTGIPKRGEIMPVSDGTLNKALEECVPRTEHVVHSFRQTAYTSLRELVGCAVNSVTLS